MVSQNTDNTGAEAEQPAEVVETTAEPSTVSNAVTFTPEQQEQINRLVAQTKRDERGKFADYNDLKTRAAKADELEQAQLTEQQKLEARAAEAERKATEAVEQIASAMIASEVKVRASLLGVIDPDAAYLLIDRSNVKYDAEAGVTGVDEALTQLLEEKPYLKGTSNRAPNLNPQSGEPAPTLRLSADQREAARLMGLTDEEYSQGL
jgi:hypothetical protein